MIKTHPAIALLEISNIAAGIKTADAMVKKSPIALLKSGTVSKGKYLILLGGSVASVDEAYQEGCYIAGENRIDSLILPDVHPRVAAAALGDEEPVAAESLGILETPHIATNIEAADAAIKGAEIEILEMRLGDGYGGKGFTILNGKIEDVEIAMEIICSIVQGKGQTAATEIIPMLHEVVALQINGPSRFRDAKQLTLSDGEKDVTG